jgi:hypothetical protein
MKSDHPKESPDMKRGRTFGRKTVFGNRIKASAGDSNYVNEADEGGNKKQQQEYETAGVCEGQQRVPGSFLIQTLLGASFWASEERNVELTPEHRHR